MCVRMLGWGLWLQVDALPPSLISGWAVARKGFLSTPEWRFCELTSGRLSCYRYATSDVVNMAEAANVLLEVGIVRLLRGVGARGLGCACVACMGVTGTNRCGLFVA